MDIHSLMNDEPENASAKSNRGAAPGYPVQRNPSIPSNSQVEPDSPNQYGNHASSPVNTMDYRAPPNRANTVPRPPPALNTRQNTYHDASDTRQPRMPTSETPTSYAPQHHHYGSPAQYSRPEVRYSQADSPPRAASQTYASPLPANTQLPSGYPPPGPPYAYGPPPSRPIVRQSPHVPPQNAFPTLNQPQSSHAQFQGHPYHQPSPSTPVGPPTMSLHRPSTHTGSPRMIQQRSTSGASIPADHNRNVPGSPASHYSPGVAHLDSPAHFSSQPSQRPMRQSTDYLRQADRERSQSVSPKSQAVRRFPSGDYGMPPEMWQMQQQSGAPFTQPRHDMDGQRFSNVPARSGVYSAHGVPSPSPLSQIQHHDHPRQQPHPNQPPHPHPHSQSQPHPHPHSHTQPHPHPHPQSQPQPQPQPQAQPHSQSQSRLHPGQEQSQQGHQLDIHTSSRQHIMEPPRPASFDRSSIRSGSAERTVADSSEVVVEPHSKREPTPNAIPQTPSQKLSSDVNDGRHNGSVDEPVSLKRKGEDLQDKQPEVKKVKIDEPGLPPIWSKLASSNPNFHIQQQKYPQSAAIKNNVTFKKDVKIEEVNPTTKEQERTNGQEATVVQDDKMQGISRLLKMPWELSFTGKGPADRLVHRIATFLYRTMLTRPQLGAGDPTNGSLEIEAKIGTLVDRNTNERIQLPVVTPCVLDENFSKTRCRFESFMNEDQHKNLNLFLNTSLQSCFAPGRCPMSYRHRYELDTFANLSPAGLSILPQCAQEEIPRLRAESRRPLHLGLRTTFDANPKLKNASRDPNTFQPPVLARIVKIRLADIDILCPEDPFDVRISVNIEIDLNHRKDIDHSLIISQQNHDEKDKEHENRPDRHKNRLSYVHSAYSIDLTQVTYNTAAQQEHKTHELEVEVDAKLLREQAELLRKGQDNAFEALVEGLVGNVFLLVRVGPQPDPVQSQK